jgi:HEAT repeat protein
MRYSSLFLTAVLLLISGVTNGQAPPTDNKEPEMKKGAQKVDGKTMFEWEKDLRPEVKDPGVKVRAIHALEFYGRDAREAVPHILHALLTDPDTSVKVNAVIALGLIGFDAKDLEKGVSTLARFASRYESQHILRYQAARALGRLGQDAKLAMPTLVYAVRDPASSEIRQSAAFALGSAGWDGRNGPDARAIHALVSALHDPCQDVRMEALFSLIVLGPPAQGTDKSAELRAIHELLHDKSGIVQIWARVAIMRLEKVSAQYLQPIAKYLKDPEPRVRINAARAFYIMGQDAKSSVKDLIYALDDKDPDVVVWVCMALGEMRSAAKEALPKLEEMVNSQEPKVRQAASDAIYKIKEKVRS